MNRTDRLYALAEELRRQGRSSTWLAERFEVSTRTIKRDIAALVEAGVPVIADEGCGGGYRLARSASLPPLTFTAGEATAIAIALAAEPGAPFRAEGRAALTKVLGAMTREQCADAKALAARVWMRSGVTSARDRSAKVLDEALRLRRVVNLDYGDDDQDRAVEPLAFARTHGHWWLLAWCRTREAGRWFRLDRVRAARLTRESATTDRPLDRVFGDPPPDAAPVRLE
ncbi:helix-turn-helix transcriptional regulator [Sandaracinus amylolyticus]|uniref:Transcriptional regulator, DeoR family protein n=1 Tax=Sandaracinus amylolyticus TaxID=927083 RepID=A0A0F6SHZ1_9BACT|nr:WYL domain-containing protein [Sandaracinus amylolyticus]AKF11284.1 Transcriptional regulator, DeoR family protein [Sandaracinus amylolyticus]